MIPFRIPASSWSLPWLVVGMSKSQCQPRLISSTSWILQDDNRPVPGEESVASLAMGLFTHLRLALRREHHPIISITRWATMASIGNKNRARSASQIALLPVFLFSRRRSSSKGRACTRSIYTQHTKTFGVGTRVPTTSKVDPHIDDPFPGWHQAGLLPRKTLETGQLQATQRQKRTGVNVPAVAVKTVCLMSCSGFYVRCAGASIPSCGQGATNPQTPTYIGTLVQLATRCTY